MQELDNKTIGKGTFAMGLVALIVSIVITLCLVFIPLAELKARAYYVEELDKLNAGAYYIEEGTIVAANQSFGRLNIKLDNGDKIEAEVLLSEIETVLNVLDWNVRGYRVAVLVNATKTEFVVLTIFVKLEVII